MFDHMNNSKVKLCRKHMENDGKGNKKPVKDLCRRSWWNSLEGSRILLELLGVEWNLGGAPGRKAETWWSS